MKKILLLLSLLISQSANAAIRTQTVSYEFEGIQMKGFLTWDNSLRGKRPGILVVHEWWGLNDYAKMRAGQLAKAGYVAFAADMYGQGKSTRHPEEAKAMVEAVRSNQSTWVGRANAALQVLRDNEWVDPTRLAAIGYCFGGATVLELAYSGADLKAVVSFHGSLPVPDSTKNIKARILILQGAEDPFVSPETKKTVEEALEAGQVNFKISSYPGAMHGFTVKGSEKLGMKGVAYNESADRLSWLAMIELFRDVFLPGRDSPSRRPSSGTPLGS